MSAAANVSPVATVPATAAPPAIPDIAQFRSRMGSIGRQSAVFFAGTILTTAAGYFFKVYLARTLGAEALGLYTLGMSFVGLLSVFSVLGLPVAASRFVAEYSTSGDHSRLGALLRSSLTVLVPANILLGVVLLLTGPWIAVHFYHAPALRPYFWAFSLIMIFGSVAAFLGQTMAGYQDVSRRTLITHFLGTPANMVFSVALISLGLGLSGYLTAQVASGLLVLVLLALFVWRMTPPEARHIKQAARMEKRVAAFSAAAFSIAVVEFILTQADKIVLGHYLDAKEVGIYSVAMGLTAFVPVALQSVNQIFSPNIAELYANGSHALLQQLYSTLTKWVLVLTVPLALSIIYFARPLLAIFGPAFQAGAVALIIGTVGQLINCGVGSVGYLLLMSGHENEMVKIQIVNAALMIATSLTLVPRFGIGGAACASGIAVTVTNIWALVVVSRRLRLFPYDASFLRLALPTLLSAFALQLVRSQVHTHSPWIPPVVALVFTYAVFIWIFMLFGMDVRDRALIRAAWEKIGFNSWKTGASR